MKRRPPQSRLVLGLLCMALGCALAAARADEVPAWSMADLVGQLKRDNPQLQQAQQAWRAAQQAVPQAAALAGPQLGLQEQANTGGPFDFRRESGFYAYYSLSQPFLWPGKRGLAGDIARAQAGVAQSQYDSLELQLEAQLRLACYQFSLLREQLRFMDQDLERLQQIKQLSRVRYANNAAGYVEALNAEVAASSLENDRYALERQVQAAREQINILLGRSSQASLELRLDEQEQTPRLPAQPLAELIGLAQRSNPAAAGSQSQVEAADKGVALARKAWYPDFQLSAGSYADPSVVQLQTMRLYSLGVSFNLPSWGFAKEKAGLDQAQAQLEAARDAQQAQAQQLELNVAGSYHALETALRQLAFTREHRLPQAQLAFRLALSGYGSSGGTAFSDLLTAQTGLRDTELALIQAQSGALQAYVSLVAAIGKEPV